MIQANDPRLATFASDDRHQGVAAELRVLVIRLEIREAQMNEFINASPRHEREHHHDLVALQRLVRLGPMQFGVTNFRIELLN